MTKFAEPDDNIDTAVFMSGGSTVGRYSQGKDPGLNGLTYTKEGACLALCLRWLGCRAMKQDFWADPPVYKGSVVDSTGEPTGVKFADKHTFTEKNTLKNPEFYNTLMGLIANGSSQEREALIKRLNKRLGLATYTGPSRSKEPLFATGTLKQDGSGLVQEVYNADCHCLVRLYEGDTPHFAIGDGHAIAFAIETNNGRRVFDPNYGEFIFDNEMALKCFQPQWWTEAKYDVYGSFQINRYHPAHY